MKQNELSYLQRAHESIKQSYQADKHLETEGMPLLSHSFYNNRDNQTRFTGQALTRKDWDKMNVTLLAYTQSTTSHDLASSGKTIALTAIRTCYSPNKPSEIMELEGEKYLGMKATDNKGGSDADRLIRHIVRSGHTSTLEHITFTFAVEGVSRALLAQLTRHRVGFSYSVQSQRYVRFGSQDRSGGFD